MREALARSDLDFSVAEPASANESARFPKILRIACIGTACVMGGVILVNALFLQDRKHPAPLLKAPDPVAVAAPEPPARTATNVAPVTPAPATTKTAGRDSIGEEIRRLSSATDARDKEPVKAPTAQSTGPRTDVIAGLIGASAAPDPAILSAQKALIRLGYVLRADGVAGATTRQAIEHYERDNKRPVRGELTTKLSRELVTRAGLAQ